MKGREILILGVLALALAGCTTGSNTNTSSSDQEEIGTSAKSPETPEVAESPAKESEEKPFMKTLELQGVTFDIESANSIPGNKVKVTTKGLSETNEPLEVEVDGTVTGAEVADLNIDQSPEVYIYISGNDPQKKGSVLGFSANKKKSLSMISVPEIASGSKEAKGYRGRDEFSVVESTLIRRFPVFKEGDADDKPTGGTRQLQYKLKPGEAAWQLVVDKVVEY